MKMFKIAAVSSNANGFGLYGHILICRDGTAYEVCRSKGVWNLTWAEGDTVSIPHDENGNPVWARVNVEIPKALPKAPAKVLKSIFKKKTP
jgi:hypothetical protein